MPIDSPGTPDIAMISSTMGNALASLSVFALESINAKVMKNKVLGLYVIRMGLTLLTRRAKKVSLALPGSTQISGSTLKFIF